MGCGVEQCHCSTIHMLFVNNETKIAAMKLNETDTMLIEFKLLNCSFG